MKKAVYTMIFGDYDDVKEPILKSNNWDYILFTNNKKIKSNNWDIRHIEDSSLSNSRLARKVWTLHHEYLPDYDLSIMMGGQIQIISDADYVLSKLMPNDDIIDVSMATHPARNCIYKEAEIVTNRRMDDLKIIKDQMERYRKEGFPKNNGLLACGVIIRKHRPNVAKHSELVWEEICKGSLRDQLSFNYVLWKHNLITIHKFDYNIIRGKADKCFKKYAHK